MIKKYLAHVTAFVLIFTIILAISGYGFAHVVSAEVLTYGPNGSVTSPGAPSANDSRCGSVFNPFSWVGCAFAAVASLILKLASLITGLAGAVLNYVVYFTVVQMSENYGKIKAINSAWMVVRDLANMFFIFVLLYASIQLILGVGKDVRKLIVNMVIAALLINFSLFFTKVAIDASNLLALTFYHAIAPDSAANGNLWSTGISDAMMKPLGLTSIWKSAGTLGPVNLITIGVMGTIFSLIATFVFVAVALMFVIRYVILIMVLILSPIAFVSSIIPGLSKYKDQWLKALTGQAIFAPVYFLLTWIVISVFQTTFSVTDLGAALTGTSIAGNSGGTVGVNTIPMLFNFVVVIAFLITSLVISKGVSDSSGNGIGKLTTWATGAAGGATFGAMGSIGRRTFGAYGQSTADSEKLKERIERGRLPNAGFKDKALAKFASAQIKTGQLAAKSTFDYRGSGVGGATVGPLEAGKPGGKGGYAQLVKDRAKESEDYVKSLEPSDIVKDQAKQDVEKTKDKYGENSTQHLRAQKVLFDLVGNRDEIKKRQEDKEKEKQTAVNKIKERDADKLKDAETTQKSYQDQVAKLQTELGAAETDIEKAKIQGSINAAKTLLTDAQKITKDIRNQTKIETNKVTSDFETQKKNIARGEIKGAGEVRKMAEAESMSNPGRFSTDRVFFVGKIKRASKQAAANLRKSKKTVTQTLEELLKTEGEIAQKETAVEEAVQDLSEKIEEKK